MPLDPDTRDNRELLVSQRNEVFAVLTGCGIAPSAFAWEITSSRFLKHTRVSTLRHRESSFYFSFDWHSATNEDGMDIGIRSAFSRSPGDVHREEQRRLLGWNVQVAAFSEWLSLLERELGQQDLWSIALRDGESLTREALDIEDNSPFRPDEVRAIQDQLEAFRSEVRASLQLHAAELARVESHVQYLRDSSERLGRKDWINLLLGVLIQLTLQVSSTSAIKDSVGKLWRSLCASLGELKNLLR